MGRRCNHAVDILRRQVRRDEADRGHMESAARKRLEDRRVVPRRACRFDSAVGRMLGEMQHLRAVGEK